MKRHLLIIGTAIAFAACNLAAQDSAPVPTFAAAPHYPAIAVAARVSGTVIVHLTIRPDGSVAVAKFASGPPMLAGAACDAGKNWKYKSIEPINIDRAADINFVFSLKASGEKDEDAQFISPDTLIIIKKPMKQAGE